MKKILLVIALTTQFNMHPSHPSADIHHRALITAPKKKVLFRQETMVRDEKEELAHKKKEEIVYPDTACEKITTCYSNCCYYICCCDDNFNSQHYKCMRGLQCCCFFWLISKC